MITIVHSSKVHQDRLCQALRRPVSPPTAATRAHDHAISNCLVFLNQKKYSRVPRVEPLCQSPSPRSSDHARVGERVRGPPHRHERGDAHRRSAFQCLQERLPGGVSWIFLPSDTPIAPKRRRNPDFIRPCTPWRARP